MNIQDQWKMSDVYADEQLWEEEIKTADNMLENIGKYEGKLCESIHVFKEALKFINDLEWKVEKVYFYANQKYHEDLGNSKYQQYAARSTELLTKYYAVAYNGRIFCLVGF